jgi:Sec-independent protein translocase protein TatA
MILELGFVIFLWLLVFGPQEDPGDESACGPLHRPLKRAASQVQTEMAAELGNPTRDVNRSDLLASMLEHRK